MHKPAPITPHIANQNTTTYSIGKRFLKKKKE